MGRMTQEAVTIPLSPASVEYAERMERQPTAYLESMLRIPVVPWDREDLESTAVLIAERLRRMAA